MMNRAIDSPTPMPCSQRAIHCTTLVEYEIAHRSLETRHARLHRSHRRRPTVWLGTMSGWPSSAPLQRRCAHRWLPIGGSLRAAPRPHYRPGRQNSGGSVLQLAGSAPIFSPRSARLFIVSLTNTPATGGDQSPGIDTTRTSMSALRLSREISAIAKRWRTAVAVAARVDVFMLCWITATQFGAITSGTGRNWLLKITQKRILGIGRFG